LLNAEGNFIFEISSSPQTNKQIIAILKIKSFHKNIILAYEKEMLNLFYEQLYILHRILQYLIVNNIVIIE